MMESSQGGAKSFNLCCPIVDRRYNFIPLRTENDLSADANATGIVKAILYIRIASGNVF